MKAESDQPSLLLWFQQQGVQSDPAGGRMCADQDTHCCLCKERESRHMQKMTPLTRQFALTRLSCIMTLNVLFSTADMPPRNEAKKSANLNNFLGIGKTICKKSYQECLNWKKILVNKTFSWPMIILLLKYCLDRIHFLPRQKSHRNRILFPFLRFPSFVSVVRSVSRPAHSKAL